MRSKRLGFDDAVVPFRFKHELKALSDYVPMDENKINGTTLALLRQKHTIIRSTEDWVLFTAKCLDLDDKTTKLALYISSQMVEMPNDKKMIYLPLTKTMRILKFSSNQTFYNSISALIYIRAIYPSTIPRHFHVNETFFTPQQRFKVSIYFEPKEVDNSLTKKL